MENLTREEYIELYNKPLEELIKIAQQLTKENFDNKVEACSIISAKTGVCPENCKYCAQSSHNHAQIECHPLLEVETVKKAAISAKENGATAFGIVTSGRRPTQKEFDKLLEMVKAVSSIEGIDCCGAFGILTEEQALKLKNAGCKNYNHNINTSENYYKDICTTHTWQDRVKTVEICKNVGMDVCCGVILGMGETREDRIDMALALKKIKPRTIPMNILNPIDGTPLESYIDKIDEEEILKTICIFRIILPTTWLKYAGGRMLRLNKENQKLGMIAGINSLIVGNYLTTLGSCADDDKQMFKELGLVLK